METEVTLAEIKTEELPKMKVAELRELCKAEGLSSSGIKKELLKRLLTKKLGRSDRFVGDLTKCRYCGSLVRVIGTDTKVISDEKTLVTRSVRCSGKHRHAYQLKEIIPAQKAG